MSCTAPSQKLLMTTAERQRVFALRFRTALCENYETCGDCEYRRKCMFAHGAHELRTLEMNEEDGLFSDKAVRDFVRRPVYRQRGTRAFRTTYCVTAATVVDFKRDELNEEPLQRAHLHHSKYRYDPYSLVHFKRHLA